MPFDPYGYDLSHQQPQPSFDALAANALLGVPQEARDVLWRGLRDAVEQAVDLWERTPAGVKRSPPALTVQHAGKPYFDEAMLCYQTQENWHCLMGLELRLAAQALEALVFRIDTEAHEMRLAEECARVGQLYNELKRRANEWVAKALLTWELRLLRYRDSPVLAPPHLRVKGRRFAAPPRWRRCKSPTPFSMRGAQPLRGDGPATPARCQT